MSLVRLKVAAYAHLSPVFFFALTRLYWMALSLASRTLGFSGSHLALSLRVSQRRLGDRDLSLLSRPTYAALAKWNAAFEDYEKTSPSRTLRLAWTHKPLGGNYGDWLSPFLLHRVTGARIVHADLGEARRYPHLVSLGSIITYANRYSSVLGAGVNSVSDYIDPLADFRMVRGFVTRDLLPRQARSSEIVCCDPGFFLGHIYQPREPKNKNRRLFIPHINHYSKFRSVEHEDFDLVDARRCCAADVEALIDEIAGASEVVTSAMHVFVTCCVYGVRCALIKPMDVTSGVSGDGIKYQDCMSPVLNEDFRPKLVEMRAGVRLSECVETRRYNLDFDHIAQSFNQFRSFLAESGKTRGS
ncbi:hypothetical protein [Sneathiella sp.]|uniref:hypothetical protein n=1 Tax=Sneathiella sp. TaxID=1964365 RepID=UPI003565CACF